MVIACKTAFASILSPPFYDIIIPHIDFLSIVCYNKQGVIRMETQYYDGTKLLSMKDLNGNTPEIFMCTTNRSAGKTTYFSRLLVNKFLKQGEKFMLLYRFNYELDDIADKFYKDISQIFFPDTHMVSRRRAHGIYHELFINETPCGYAVSLNGADQIKKNSHMFSDTKRMFFDEFQSETNHYCADEISKFISIHTSVARGIGEQSRYVPVYMTSNPVSILNPYYVELGISERIKTETKFLRGIGFVLEQGYVDSANRALAQSAFNSAFNKTRYMAYTNEATYLSDNTAFIEKPTGFSKYSCTLKYLGKEYGIREFPEEGIVYCDDRPDKTFPYKISVTTEDHQINYIMLKHSDFFLSNLRYYFERGCFRFKNLLCKEAVLKALSY